MIKTIGFLGCGNMGGAIARAVCKATDPQNVYLANRTAAKAEALAAALGCAFRRVRVAGAALPGWVQGTLVAGCGGALAILWELAEYRSFLMDTAEVVSIYQDTLGDEVLGLTGAVAAGGLAWWRARRDAAAGSPGR